jgi:hypothetical protein
LSAVLLLTACAPRGGEPESGDGTAQPESADGSQSAAAASAPPNPDSGLFLSDSGWEALARECREGLGATLKARLLADAGHWLEVKTDPYPFGKPYEHYEQTKKEGHAQMYNARVFTRQVVDLAVAARLTGEDRYAKQAAAILESAARQHDVGYYANKNALAVGDALYGTALAYGWLEDSLDPEVRDLVRERIRSLGTWLAENSGRKFCGREQVERYLHNWNAVTHAPLGLAGILLEEPAWVDLATHRIGEFFRYAVDETGANFEGANYLGYGFGNAMPFAVELKRRTGRDFFEEFPKLRRTPDYILWTLEPWGGGVVELNQTPKSVVNNGWLFYLFSRFQDATGLWTWLRLVGDEDRYGGDGSYGALGAHHFPSTAFALLWHDPAPEPEEPRAAPDGDLKVFERGIAVARDGWRETDTLLTFVSAESYGAVWNHPDANSFTFYALGERFAADAGAHALETTDHNAILVNGYGMDSRGGPQPAQGELVFAEQTGDRVVLRGDATEAYAGKARAEQALRDLGLKLGEHPHLLVSDRFDSALAGEFDKKYSWNLVTGEGNEIRLGEDGRSAVIVGARNGALCDLTVLHPVDATLEKIPAEGRTPPRLFVHQRAEDGRFLILLTPRRAGESPAEVVFEPAGGLEPSGTLTVDAGKSAPTVWRIVGGEIQDSP